MSVALHEAFFARCRPVPLFLIIANLSLLRVYTCTLSFLIALVNGLPVCQISRSRIS